MTETSATKTGRHEASSPSIVRRRNSIRLHGFDYSQPGEYFVTIGTMGRRHLFGDVKEGGMQLSVIGKIVDECWHMIPGHFLNTRVDTFQLMPDHIHGIIEIKELRRGVQLNAPTGNHFSEISAKKGSLGVIVRTFKAAVMTEVRKTARYPNASIWQRSFYDHIIRDDIDQYFIQEYIALNPVIWELRAGNISVEAFRKTLREIHSLDDYAIEHVIEFADTYRVIKE